MEHRSGWQKIEGGGAVWVEVARYRLMSFDLPLAPWRATKSEAYQDAIDLRVGTRSRHSKIVYLTVPAWIAKAQPNAETEASVRRRERRLVEVANASRISRRSPRGYAHATADDVRNALEVSDSRNSPEVPKAKRRKAK